MFLLGVDAGTSVIKAALFDRDLNNIAVASSQTTLRTPHPGWTEVSMEETWTMAAQAIRTVIQQAGVAPQDIAGVGVTGNMVGAWLIDAHGEPLRDAILHTDNRAQSLIQQMTEQHPDFHETVFGYSGSAMQPGCTLPLVRWLADHEPETLNRAAHVLCCKDWLVYKLTGSIQIDPSEASVMPGDTRERDYAEPLFDLMGIQPYWDLFPAVLSSEAVVGQVTTAASEATGLAAGTPVVTGAGDVLATGIGAGAVLPGVAYAILGTAGINGLVMDEPILEPQGIGLTFCQPGGNWVRVMVNTLGTPNLDWFVRQFFPDNAFDELEHRAQQSGPGANGIIYLPYLSPTGVFAPFVEASARAEFFGLTLDHSRDDMLRAVYEGVALSIRHCYEAMPQAVDEIRLTGGGANSAFWSQMIADITGRRVVIPDGQEFGARGSAFLAGLAMGWFQQVADAAALSQSLRVHQPEPKPTYEATYQTYQALTEALRPVWHHHINMKN